MITEKVMKRDDIYRQPHAELSALWEILAYCPMLWGQTVSRPHAKSDYVRQRDAFCSKMMEQSVADGGFVPMVTFVTVTFIFI